jgi:hypothetical protein
VLRDRVQAHAMITDGFSDFMSPEEIPPVVITLGETRIEIWEHLRHILTRFPDGSVLTSRPDDSRENRALARLLGYGSDLWTFCREREILHTAMSIADGRPFSNARRRKALDLPPDEDAKMEDARVLSRLAERHGGIWTPPPGTPANHMGPPRIATQSTGGRSPSGSPPRSYNPPMTGGRRR